MECPKFWSSTAALLHCIHSALQYCVAFGVHAICICLIFVTSSISPLLESLVMQLLHHGQVMISSIGQLLHHGQVMIMISSKFIHKLMLSRFLCFFLFQTNIFKLLIQIILKNNHYYILKTSIIHGYMFFFKLILQITLPLLFLRKLKGMTKIP